MLLIILILLEKCKNGCIDQKIINAKSGLTEQVLLQFHMKETTKELGMKTGTEM